MDEVFGQYPLHYMVSPGGAGIVVPEDEAQGEQMGVTQTFHMDMMDTMRARAQAPGYMLVAVPYVEPVEPVEEVVTPDTSQNTHVSQAVEEARAQLLQAQIQLAKAQEEQNYP